MSDHFSVDTMRPLSSDYESNPGMRPTVQALSDSEEILRLGGLLLERQNALDALNARIESTKVLAVSLSDFLEQRDNKLGADAVELVASALGGG